jgi:hypothetical protein
MKYLRTGIMGIKILFRMGVVENNIRYSKGTEEK